MLSPRSSQDSDGWCVNESGRSGGATAAFAHDPSTFVAGQADLVASGDDPEARMKALGVEKVEDRDAVEAAVARR